MKTSTAIAALFLAGVLTPVAGTSAEPKHAGHKPAHHAASGSAKSHGAKSHSGAAHGKASKASSGAHGKSAHGKSAHGKSAKSDKHGKKGKPEKKAHAPPPPPPPKPQVLTAPSRTDRLVLPTNAMPSHYDIVLTPDMATNRFKGRVKIDLALKSPAKQIKFNAAGLVFESVKLTGASGGVLNPRWEMDPEQETATLNFNGNIKAGRYVLEIAYSGGIASTAAGLFHLDYATPSGTKSALFTQFENSDARRVFPSWDEPARKATFTLAVDTPTDLTAVSNMPQQGAEGLPNGLTRVRFKTTPLMSPYLLFVGVGDFERVTRQVGPTEIGVVVRKGEAARTKYALDAAADVLGYYNDYFGVPYPLPKLDLIAGPGSSQFFGAMENYGAIFFFEKAVLVDPALSTEADKERAYTVVAHEIAHQWFGDLVTMEWWDDLWLNEGFARWMQTKATSRFHPEWKLELKSLVSRDQAMGLDAREGAHAVVQHVKDVHQASSAFDTITYDKGAAVLGMIEAEVGPDVFRAGVRRYIHDHQNGVAVSDDLWAAIDAVSLVKITSIAHDFTLQPGVPLVTFTPDAAAGASLTQGRFGLDAASKTKLRWETPVTAARVNGGGGWRGVISTLEPASLKPPVDGLVVNAGQSGYFRTQYAGGSFARLIDAWPKLTPADQIGLLNDVYALSLNGDQPVADLLNLIDRAGGDLDSTVAATVIDKIKRLAAIERDQPGEAAFRAFALKRLQNLKAGLDASPTASTDPGLQQVRSGLSEVLADFGDADALATAKARYVAWRTDPAGIKADDRRSMLKIMAQNADPQIFSELRDLANKAGSALERQEYLNLLATAKDPALARQAMDLSISAQTPVTEGLNMIKAVGQRYPDMALEFIFAHPDEIRSRLDAKSATRFVPGIASLSFDVQTVKKLDAYALVNLPDSAHRVIAAAQSAVQINHAQRARRAPEIDRWIAQHAN